MEILVPIILLVFAVGGYFALRKSARMEQALSRSMAQKDISPFSSRSINSILLRDRTIFIGQLVIFGKGTKDRLRLI